MAEIDRARCRQAARECIELACITADRKTKALLLKHAQEWTKLAYREHDARFREIVAGFNADRLMPPRPMRHQPVRQQQSKTGD